MNKKSADYKDIVEEIKRILEEYGDDVETCAEVITQIMIIAVNDVRQETLSNKDLEKEGIKKVLEENPKSMYFVYEKNLIH